MRSALENKFFGMNQRVIQQVHSTCSIQSGKSPNNWHLAYRQLWLYAMRHFTELPAPREEETTTTTKKKKTLLAKARTQKVDEVILSEFAALADQL